MKRAVRTGVEALKAVSSSKIPIIGCDEGYKLYVYEVCHIRVPQKKNEKKK